VLIYLFLYAPVCGVIAQSFNRAPRGTEWRGFTTNWYAVLAHNEAALDATRVTLLLAAMSTAVSTVLGTLLGLALTRGKFFGRQAAEWTLQAVIVVPDIVMAIGLLMFYAVARRGLEFLEPGLLTMTLALLAFAAGAADAPDKGNETSAPALRGESVSPAPAAKAERATAATSSSRDSGTRRAYTRHCNRRN
jgi:ABC-type spermidine/putrescine transport system permease subunit II